MLNVKDYPGCISVEAMRPYFEGLVKGTPAFAKNTPLGIVTINDRFSHYADPDTDTLWLGFAMGMRCAERIEKAKATQP